MYCTCQGFSGTVSTVISFLERSSSSSTAKFDNSERMLVRNAKGQFFMLNYITETFLSWHLSHLHS